MINFQVDWSFSHFKNLALPPSHSLSEQLNQFLEVHSKQDPSLSMASNIRGTSDGNASLVSEKMQYQAQVSSVEIQAGTETERCELLLCMVRPYIELTI